ncbi:D-aminoacyl-tRNA deacylase [Marinovum sp. 2_MG-2023]|uniref:D-aminoacyl-tRNA deacylase n=1 Tax=unclassified Marinovum TaxID=2647166 RepID=UPI0026E22B38|nr:MULTISPECIES: D-aminoacyl-tRNA deacylase [unclassified Marinovum]MDO6730752.1 D-aminoacyl-tRNA deacylase [Marinovum sp. 2_MG-2023]MDO6780043.1 D-aminoacyl-tRNA deacylase [Marinovum sp. 1_MG-2023]
MRAVLQRVSEAAVRVDGQRIGQCGPGLMILICAMQGDTTAEAEKLAAKTARLRIFPDETGKMNRALRDINGSALVISQFTLAADCRRGNRPGFSAAAPPDIGETLYLAFAEALRGEGITVETGRFGANMQVSLINDGPVTIPLDTDG